MVNVAKLSSKQVQRAVGVCVLSGVLAAGLTSQALAADTSTETEAAADLLAVQATNGEEGYISLTELEEAAKLSATEEGQQAFDAEAAQLFADKLNAEGESDVEFTTAEAAALLGDYLNGERTGSLEGLGLSEAAANRINVIGEERAYELVVEVLEETSTYIPVVDTDGESVVGAFPVTQIG